MKYLISIFYLFIILKKLKDFKKKIFLLNQIFL